jgi:hypothetical protein
MRPLPTAEEIVSLFGKHGLEVNPDVFLDEGLMGIPPCGCAVGVLLIDAAGGMEQGLKIRRESDSSAISLLAEKTNWPRQFVDGLSDGFGAGEIPSESCSANWKRGYEISQEAFRLLREKGLCST